MASSTRHLCRSLRQASKRIASPRIPSMRTQQQVQRRPFSYASIRLADEPASTDKAPPAPAPAPASSAKDTPKEAQLPTLSSFGGDYGITESEYLTPAQPYQASDLTPEERAQYEVLSKKDQAGYLCLQNHIKALVESSNIDQDMMRFVDEADKEIERAGGSLAIEFPTNRAKGRKEIGYWAEDEEDEFGQMPDEDNEWHEEDITSVAQSEMDLHRDIREYTRIAAWDLPLLNQYAKPFQPPNHSTPLRFRYTTYMGESHPAARKVVVEFCLKDLLSHPSPTYKLNEPQRIKFIKLIGVRYNPENDVVKMSCEKFETAAQNKRYLGELIGSLIKEAKDKRDEFKDIPMDLRHHKSKPILKFPEEWKLSNKSAVKELSAFREQQKLLPLEEENAVDGAELVEQYVRVGQLKETRALR